jgi:hypothetical protein
VSLDLDAAKHLVLELYQIAWVEELVRGKQEIGDVPRASMENSLLTQDGALGVLGGVHGALQVRRRRV